MTNKPQTLSQGQREEVIGLLRKQVIGWTLIGLALFTGVFGVGLWQMKQRIEDAIEKRTQETISAQFEEPRIKVLLDAVATEKAAFILEQSVQPAVDRFRAEITGKEKDLDALVAQTKTLEQVAADHAKNFDDSLATIRAALASSQQVLAESQQVRDKIVGLQSDIVRMQKAEARIQYYELKGRNTFPNPYQPQVIEALNDIITIAIPDPIERQTFISQLGGPNL